MPPMKGKKGKKKMYPPEVARFLQTHEYKCIRGLLELPGGIPSVHQPSIDEETQKSIASLLSVLGRIATAIKYTPAGYPPEIVQNARTILTGSCMVLVSGRAIMLDTDEELPAVANQFLMDVDFNVSGIVKWIEQGLSTDFSAMGLVAFETDLRERFRVFDSAWVEFEERLLTSVETVTKEIFKPIDSIVDLEAKLSCLENAQDYANRLGVEKQFVSAVTEYPTTDLTSPQCKRSTANR
ncbi:hypothetical protein BESB_037530 [Besnoitia besnoiti]|uniref:Uncharacterized protein n=1 Tax=Besnoitia besnoiti TaxID=94643 RepID=A0A2A9MH49_BESBE|nr:hypothetical protein BESB_037530 [Besnoitia besnoiti]PFH37295.1 hypothetical protein BESB_037530 [Besnoitia besnoiti]